MAAESSGTKWLDAFNNRWAHPDYPPIEVKLADLERAEKYLSYAFPASYRDAVLALGLPRPTTDLWGAIDEKSDLPHLSDFLTPLEIIGTVRDWTPAGYPVDLVPFASDSGDNLLSFQREDADDAIYLWDHDFGTVRQIASSFANLIEAYCNHLAESS